MATWSLGSDSGWITSNPEVIRSLGLVPKNALMTSDRAPFLVRRKPGSNLELNTECRYAAIRISSILKGSTKQFGWLQAPAKQFAKAQRHAVFSDRRAGFRARTNATRVLVGGAAASQ